MMDCDYSEEQFEAGSDAAEQRAIRLFTKHPNLRSVSITIGAFLGFDMEITMTFERADVMGKKK